MLTHGALSILVFLLTLLLVILRPYKLNVGYTALFGATVSLFLGTVNLRDVLFILFSIWDAVLAFVFLVFISIILERVGFFEWSALVLLSFSKGNGFLFYLYLMMLTSATSALFANDGAMLMLTPLLYNKLKVLRLKPVDMIPYFIAVGFMSESASLPFIISNLTNIMTARYFGLGFWEYAVYMFFPYLTSSIFTTLILWLLYRKHMVRRFDPEAIEDKPPYLAVRDPFIFRLAWMLIPTLGIAFLFVELFHVKIPVSLILFVACLILSLSTLRNRVVSLKLVFRLTPWHIVAFALGMYVVVYGLKNAGLVGTVSVMIKELYAHGSLTAILGVGIISSFLSALLNNLPAVLMINLSIGESQVPEHIRTFLGLANVVGANIGQKITPIGSLATLLWLHLLKTKGVNINISYYFRVHILLSLITTLVVLMSLWIVYLIGSL